jgi:hypothetical protein
MFVSPKHVASQAIRHQWRASTRVKCRYASRIEIPFQPPPVPVIESCPVPTCQCRQMPEGLQIEQEQNINGSMPAYAQQVLVSTGRNNWASKIEDDEGNPVARRLKSFLGRGGKYSNVRATVCILTLRQRRTNRKIAISQCHHHQFIDLTDAACERAAFKAR